MKIRRGFVSNSSSSSFMIPSCFLNEEQKEVVFSVLSAERKSKEKINEKLGQEIFPEERLYPEKGLSRRKEYHEIFQDMIQNGEWNDHDWHAEYSYDDGKFVIGCCSMWNGSLGRFFEKIGIDITALQIINHGHNSVHMATHPEAILIFADKRDKEIKQFQQDKKEYDALSEEEKENSLFKYEYMDGEIVDNPYKEFEIHGEKTFSFNSKDGYTYWRFEKDEN